MSGHERTAAEPAEPLPRVVRGDPTDEQLAALVAVVAARRAVADDAAAPPTPARRSGWAARDRTLRGVHRHGAGQWRAAARTR